MNKLIKKVLNDLILQNIFRIWSSVLTKLMTTGRWVSGLVECGRCVGGSVVAGGFNKTQHGDISMILRICS